MMEEILPGLFRIVLPLPGNPLKEINSYVLTSEDRNLIIDTGMNRPECQEVLNPALSALGIDLGRTDIIATHYHADHQGLVFTLLRNGSKAYMGTSDALAMEAGSTTHARKVPMGDYAAISGFPEAELRWAQENHPGFKYGPQAVVNYIHLKEGDGFTIGEYRLQVIETPGHTGGHVCLYDARNKILFSGDHVLGDITPNIQAWTDDDDPLGKYIQSLDKIRNLEVSLCLPGHRSVIRDLEKRIEELIEHHRVRANEVLAILERGPRNAYRTASEMTWDIVAKSWEDFPVMQKWFATGEAIAHLRFLEDRNFISRELINGIITYSAPSSSSQRL
jgi:glyoxylase-like metal-dependent hydrolase (beta-lactamase superfamily II)